MANKSAGVVLAWSQSDELVTCNARVRCASACGDALYVYVHRASAAPLSPLPSLIAILQTRYLHASCVTIATVVYLYLFVFFFIPPLKKKKKLGNSSMEHRRFHVKLSWKCLSDNVCARARACGFVYTSIE